MLDSTTSCTLTTVIGDEAGERQDSSIPLAVTVTIVQIDADNDGSADDVRVTLTVVDTPDFDYTADVLVFYFDVAGDPFGALTIQGAVAESDTTLEGSKLADDTFDYAVRTGIQGGSDGINNGATFTLLNFDIGLLELQNIGVRAQSISVVLQPGSTATLPSGSDSQKLVGTLPECYSGTIEGYKYEDNDGSGATAGDRTGLAGVTIELYTDLDNNGVIDGADAKIATDVTDANGYYSFTGLNIGNYVVKELVPDGSYAVTPVTVQADLTASVDTVSDINFANTQKASITGEKYEDTNGAAAGGLVTKSGWTVQLYEVGDTDGDGTANELLETTATDANGVYTFSNLKLGTYRVVEDADGPDGTWYAVGPTEYNVTLDESGEVYGDSAGENTDFTNIRKASITGEKYEDSNGAAAGGTMTAVPNWTVRLFYDSNNDGDFNDAGENVAFRTTTTNASGVYTFSDLVLGNYKVVEDTSDTAWYAVGPTEHLVTLDQSGEVYGNDAGETTDFYNSRYGEVVVTKWWDRDGSGTETAGDKKLGGWTFMIDIDNDGDIDQEGTTDALTGTVTFTGLKVGDVYTIYEEGRDGWSQKGVVGTNPGTISVSGEVDQIAFFNTFDCFEGLTPGFWRQSQNWRKQGVDAQTFWQSVDDRPGETIDGRGGQATGDGINFTEIFNSTVTFGDLFGVSNFTVRIGNKTENVANLSLVRAVSIEGGGDAGALARHAVAAAMNASADEVDYAYTVQEVINMVREAITGANYDPGAVWTIASAKAELEENNELGIDYDAQCAYLHTEGLTVIDPVWA
ncbi:MSCRAMM family protein [Falsiroseomonas oryziterrae]|uniref:MSCRAMM family protein n=1 Tax=Falsiroseomonas oryziterrae TaxID=2911368 RepID=UPI001F1FFD95|nr:SpaA isopeptide-forming pilin-related protein [Roseomonas sp. NPKOSM-4]